MPPEAWTLIGIGVAILAVIAASNRQLCGEIKEIRGEVKELHSQISGLRERMTRLEGLIEWLREAISGRKAV